MKTILVTGGAGFIGANFVRMILSERKDIKLVNLDALTYAGNLENLAGFIENKQHVFVHGDIRSRDLLENIFRTHKIDGIINFAAESHVDRSISSPGIFIDTNISGTLNLLQCSKEFGIGRFLQVSTDEVYGSLSPDEDSFTEETGIKPNSPYSASKASADLLVRAFNHTYHIDTVITRCSNNYGPYQFPEKMIPLCINNIQKGKPIPVYGDGLQIRDWLYVYDHCAAILKVFEKGKSGEVYNIGGNNEKTNLELVKTLLRLLGKDESLITYVKDRPGHDRRYAIDNSKITGSLGWKPSLDFEEGISKTVNWYLNNKSWMDHVTSGEYHTYYEKMYLNK